jgi:hypothetical protein
VRTSLLLSAIHNCLSNTTPAACTSFPAAVRHTQLLQTTQPVLPSWTFQSSALQELWGCEPEEEADLDWSARAPQLSASLVPLVDGETAE